MLQQLVRVPVIGGHSESVNVELLNDFNLEEVKDEIALIQVLLLKMTSKIIFIQCP